MLNSLVLSSGDSATQDHHEGILLSCSYIHASRRIGPQSVADAALTTSSHRMISEKRKLLFPFLYLTLPPSDSFTFHFMGNWLSKAENLS